MTLYRSDAAAPAPIEGKVKAATTGAGIGAALAQLICWALDLYVLTPGTEDGVPAPVSIGVTALIAAGLAYAAGYRAKHTPRSDLDAPAEIS